ncbi:MAG: DUF2572 family protein, partial [Gammaproteobacteria bacterium]|nr:DUF2572 family protein [Gammaproteobacteria bacterium]
GTDANTVEAGVNLVYANGSNPNLNGKQGVSIFVDDDLNLSGKQTIGSPTQPVLLIVNGNVSFSGQVTFYGFIFALNNLSASGQANIVGSIATGGRISFSGNVNVTFNTPVMNTLVVQTSSAANFGKVPGSWRDF